MSDRKAATTFRDWGAPAGRDRGGQPSAPDKLREGVQEAIRDGLSEAEAARQSGVTRMTVRAWLGKR